MSQAVFELLGLDAPLRPRILALLSRALVGLLSQLADSCHVDARACHVDGSAHLPAAAATTSAAAAAASLADAHALSIQPIVGAIAGVLGARATSRTDARAGDDYIGPECAAALRSAFDSTITHRLIHRHPLLIHAVCHLNLLAVAADPNGGMPARTHAGPRSPAFAPGAAGGMIAHMIY